MINEKYINLAKVLVNYSVHLHKGEKVLIEAIDTPIEMLQAVVNEVLAIEAIPIVDIKKMSILRELYMNATELNMSFIAQYELERMQKMDAWIGIRGSDNSKELIDVPHEKTKIYNRLWLKPVHFEERVNNTKWVVVRAPTPGFAQEAKMSTEAFEEFYFKVCTGVNWAKASKAMDSLVNLMNDTKKVQIKGPGTELTFSIKGIPAVKCDGHYNIPDLEVFTAPIIDSVNGKISYNAPSTHDGYTFKDIRLEFKNGKIINAEANDTERINKIFNSDAGARFIGEFALGLHPMINKPIDDILFDEKINGSFHFTPGGAYENEADNGNRSMIHWDLVCVQTPEFGGGEIYFDNKLIRKDGRFVTKDLEKLNPENLVK
jgi:aminopeptidase